MDRQSNWGKLVDFAFIAGIVFLLWSKKISEMSGFALLAAIAQARGSVGAVGKVMGALGSSGPGGGPQNGSSGGSGVSNRPPLPASNPPESNDTTRRIAISAVRSETVVGWSVAALAIGLIGLWLRAKHIPFHLALLAIAVGGCSH